MATPDNLKLKVSKVTPRRPPRLVRTYSIDTIIAFRPQETKMTLFIDNTTPELGDAKDVARRLIRSFAKAVAVNVLYYNDACLPVLEFSKHMSVRKQKKRLLTAVENVSTPNFLAANPDVRLGSLFDVFGLYFDNLADTSNGERNELVVISDGKSSRQQEIVELIRQNEGKTRVFCMGIGECNRDLLESVSSVTEGTVEYVLTQDAASAEAAAKAQAMLISPRGTVKPSRKLASPRERDAPGPISGASPRTPQESPLTTPRGKNYRRGFPKGPPKKPYSMTIEAALQSDDSSADSERSAEQRAEGAPLRVSPQGPSGRGSPSFATETVLPAQPQAPVDDEDEELKEAADDAADDAAEDAAGEEEEEEAVSRQVAAVEPARQFWSVERYLVISAVVLIIAVLLTYTDIIY